MKLFEYLKVHDDMDDVMGNCGEYIKAAKHTGMFLYRGSKTNSYEDVSYIVPRTNREPKSSSIEFHDFCDKYFLKKFGWAARSGGVFAKTGHISRIYGTPYLFFPVDGFKFIWSPKVSDLFGFDWLIRSRYPLRPMDVENIKYTMVKGIFPNPKIELDMDPTQALENILGTYIDDKFDLALASEFEIMFKCDGYYMVNKSEKYIKEVIGE